MAILAFLRYAAQDVLRNRRRTFAAILGVLLTVTFVAGTLIAVDSSARATLNAFLAGVPGDFGFNARTANATAIRDAVRAVPGVVDVSTYRSVPTGEIGSPSLPHTWNTSVVGIDPEHRPSMLRNAVVVGSLDLPRGTIGLSMEIANQLDFSIGDRVFLAYTTYNFTTNLTERTRLNLTLVALLSGLGSGGFGPRPEPYYFYGGLAVVHIRDVGWISEQLRIPSDGSQIVGEVWIDRDRFIDPYDVDASRRNLARLQRQIDFALVPFDGSSFDNIQWALQTFQFVLFGQRVAYIGLSLPVIFLGLYLGAVGVDLGHAERRRELAIFKTRGAAPRQTFGLLLVEAVVGGVVASVLGLFAGLGLSRLLLGIVTPIFGSARYTDVVLSLDTIITTVVLAVLFMLISAYRSAKRTAKLPVVETLRYYAPGETRIEYKPTADVIMVGLAVAVFAGAFWMRGGVTSILAFFFGIIFFLLLPIAPVLLIVGVTRLATRSTGRVYEWASRALRPLAKDLYPVINRNVARNPRRSSNICVIVALGLAFGLFTLTFFGSQQAADEQRLRASIGADLAAFAPATDEGFGANLSKVPGVAGVSELLRLSGYVNPVYSYADVWVVDPSTLFVASRPEPWYFVDGNADAAAAVLQMPGRVLITRTYADAAFLAAGDRLVLSGSRFNETTGMWDTVSLAVTVGGLVRSLPGTNEYAFSALPQIFGTEVSLGLFVNRSQIFEASYLAALAPGSDWRSVKENATALGAQRVRVYSEELERLNQDPLRQAASGFLGLEIAFAAVILTAGLALVTFAAVLERNVEFAAIVARGASGKQTAALLVGEAVSILMIGLVVGAAVGLLSSWIMIQVFLIGPPGQPESLVPFSFVLPPNGIWFVVAAPLAMVAAVLVVAWRIVHMDVARTLRVRGG